MATLVLTAVGTLVGGPIGGAIGAALGSRIDGTLFAPKRRGPRLGDLSVQTSSYGAPIPKLFGTMRVAGTVIWATDLKEDAHRSGGGKGGGSTTTYSYSASFAVALSGRAVRRVGRIWADGKLLRGAGGDWKSEAAAFRLHPGDEDQAADPLIASAEGVQGTPAHRGIAYAVFDTLQLADFGNRIPSLSFEVEADEGPVELGAIAAALSEGAIGGTAGASVGGYAAGGDTVRAAIETLADAFPLPVTDDGTVLRLGHGAVAPIDPRELGSRADGRHEPRIARERRAASALPDEVILAYHEPERDYQAGVQQARRGGVALRAARIELPAALGASEAKGAAEAALARAWTGRERATVRLPWRRIDWRAGQSVTLAGQSWRIAAWSLEHMALTLSLERSGGAAVPVAASPGHATGAPDRAAGQTRIALIDMPAFDGSGGGAAPRLWLAAAGTGAGWRRATASLSLDAGASWRTIGITAPAATMGVTIEALGVGPATLIDRVNAIDVELLHDDMVVPGGGEAALLAGRNLALVGDELIGFADATQLAPRRWRLSGLLRGRFGTEGAIGTQAAGARFVLIEAGRLLPIDLPTSAIGGPVAVSAIGPGETETAEQATTLIARALRPPAPVALRAARLGDGTIRIGWTRRSRAGWAWIDGTDAPIGEDRELYRLTLSAAGVTTTVETGEAGYDWPSGAQPPELAAGGATLAVTVAQIGSLGPSLPLAERTFTF